MHLVILAAGLGSRLMPLTSNKPKCLLKVNEEKILERLIKQASQTKEIKNIIVVTGYRSSQIEELVDELNQRKNILPITIVYNPYYRQTNNIYSLWCCKHLINGNFVLCDGDLMIEKEIFKKIIGNSLDKLEISKIAIDLNIELDEEAMKLICDENDNLIKVTKNPDPGEISKGESIGICYVSKKDSKELMNHIATIVKSGDVNSYYEKAFQKYINHGWSPKVIDVSEYNWVEIDDMDDYNNALKTFRLMTSLGE